LRVLLADPAHVDALKADAIEKTWREYVRAQAQ